MLPQLQTYSVLSSWTKPNKQVAPHKFELGNWLQFRSGWNIVTMSQRKTTSFMAEPGPFAGCIWSSVRSMSSLWLEWPHPWLLMVRIWWIMMFSPALVPSTKLFALLSAAFSLIPNNQVSITFTFRMGSSCFKYVTYQPCLNDIKRLNGNLAYLDPDSLTFVRWTRPSLVQASFISIHLVKKKSVQAFQIQFWPRDFFEIEHHPARFDLTLAPGPFITLHVECSQTQLPLSRSGFYEAILGVLRLRQDGLMTMGPPCSSFVWISSSCHGRGPEKPYGNEEKSFVNTGSMKLAWNVF